jgi:L-rhamnose isomerase
MARMEEFKTLPWGSVWSYYCAKNNLPDDFQIMDEIKSYEKEVLLKR